MGARKSDPSIDAPADATGNDSAASTTQSGFVVDHVGSLGRSASFAYEESDADGDGGAPSGVAGARARAERETTPAPPGDEDWTLPSVRPTSVPEFDLDAFALGTALRHQAKTRLPVDVTVPFRTVEKAPVDLALRLAFVLLHVDGRSSVRDISRTVALPVDETLNLFLELTTHGLVDLGGPRGPRSFPSFSSPDVVPGASRAAKAPNVPTSGEYERVQVPSKKES